VTIPLELEAQILSPSATVPRDGSMILSDVHWPTLTIVSERCGRYGRYSAKRLIAKQRCRREVA
jgi:hypothetical protein